MKLGEKLRFLRLREGITVRQLGSAVGVSRQQIVNWETGRYVPDMGQLRALATALCAPPADFDPETLAHQETPDLRGEVSGAIQRYRRDLGYTQQQLADLLGVSVQVVRNWEQHKRGPSLEFAVKLANALTTRKSEEFIRELASEYGA